MNLTDFQNDYPDQFEACIDDIDWHKVFFLISSCNHGLMADYLYDHFASYQEGLMPQDGPDHDAKYDEKRQAKADALFSAVMPKPDLSFLDAVHITNMTRDKWDK